MKTDIFVGTEWRWEWQIGSGEYQIWFADWFLGAISIVACGRPGIRQSLSSKYIQLFRRSLHGSLRR